MACILVQRPLTFHNVKNHGGGGAGEPGRIARNEEQKKNNTRQTKIKQQRKTSGQTIQSVFFFFVKTSPGKRRRPNKNNAYARLGVEVFRLLGVLGRGFGVFRCFGGVLVLKVNDILERQRVTREGAQKWPKIQYGLKPDISQRAAQNGQKFGWGKISTLWASSSAKKVLLTAEKVGSAQNRRKFRVV